MRLGNAELEMLTLTVLPARPSGARSYVTGAGTLNAAVGITSTFCIQLQVGGVST